MTISALDNWIGNRIDSLPLVALKDAVIGIAASHYLERQLTTPKCKEKLLSAHGGAPLGLRQRFEADLDILQEAGITPFFVFSGMDVKVKDIGSRGWEDRVAANTSAWDFYDGQRAPESVEEFGNSNSVKPEQLFRVFQKILQSNNIGFIVAPYAAEAQLSYFANMSKPMVDAVYASTEALLYDIDKVIVKFDFESPPSPPRFSWLGKQGVLEQLNIPSADLFVDACLLSGTSFLPTFPPLENPRHQRKPFTIRDTTQMMNNFGRSVSGVCNHYQDDSQVQQLDYLDRYRRAKMSVKHHVVFTEAGTVEPLELDKSSSDVHDFIGPRFPEELYFYLSKGVIGPRVLNWLANGQFLETPPLDNGESEDYRRLVSEQLTPLRTITLSLLTQPLHRYYQSKDRNVTVNFWFNSNFKKVLNHANMSPAPASLVSAWHVRESDLEIQKSRIKAPPGSFLFAVASLTYNEFPPTTITKRDYKQTLTTKDEILCNIIWRFLQTRGYIAEDHTLTAWGKALFEGLSSIDPADELEEAVFLAIELLRLDLVNSKDMFPHYSGGPAWGSDLDKANCLLISRIATLSTLHHQPTGFHGPLSRSILAYHCMISSLTATLRDMLEVLLTALFLNGDAARDRSDYLALSLALPFLDTPHAGLGIAVKHYLDDLAMNDDPTADATREDTKRSCEGWFREAGHFRADLERAWALVGAVESMSSCARSEGLPCADVSVSEWLEERK